MFGSLASEQNSITRICRSVRGIIMGDLGDLSFWHWLIPLGYIASVTVPFYKIFPRAGIPAWIAVFGVVPFVALTFLWMLAFMRWPQDDVDRITAAHSP
jgi:hypothetical protein